MNTPSNPPPDAQDSLSAILAPVVAAQQALDAATVAYNRAKSRPLNALNALIQSGTDFGHPLMPIVLARTHSSVGSGPEFLPTAQDALETLGLIETKGTEFCIAHKPHETYGWQVWFGTCTGAKIDIADPPGANKSDFRNRITFPFNMKSHGDNHAMSVQPQAVTRECPAPEITHDMSHGIISRMAGASPISCRWVIAFGAAKIEDMINGASTWEAVALARSVVVCGRNAALAEA